MAIFSMAKQKTSVLSNVIGGSIVNFAWFFLNYVCRIKLTIPEEMKCKQFILVSNHLSHLDWLFLLALFQKKYGKKIRFIAKKELLSSRIWSHVVKYGQAIPIDRNRPGKKTFRHALDVVKKGESLGIFPEGTRSANGELQKALDGCAFFWQLTKIPILPVGIKNLHEVLPKGKKIPRKMPCEIRIGVPIYFPSLSNGEKIPLGNLTKMIMSQVALLSGQDSKN